MTEEKLNDITLKLSKCLGLHSGSVTLQLSKKIFFITLCNLLQSSL